MTIKEFKCIVERRDLEYRELSVHPVFTKLLHFRSPDEQTSKTSDHLIESTVVT